MGAFLLDLYSSLSPYEVNILQTMFQTERLLNNTVSKSSINIFVSNKMAINYSTSCVNRRFLYIHKREKLYYLQSNWLSDIRENCEFFHMQEKFTPQKKNLLPLLKISTLHYFVIKVGLHQIYMNSVITLICLAISTI